MLPLLLTCFFQDHQPVLFNLADSFVNDTVDGDVCRANKLWSLPSVFEALALAHYAFMVAMMNVIMCMKIQKVYLHN